MGTVAGRRQFCDCSVDLGPVAAIDHDRRAMCRQTFGERKANTLTGPCDKGKPPLEAE